MHGRASKEGGGTVGRHWGETAHAQLARQELLEDMSSSNKGLTLTYHGLF